jgi:hypothetical protein
VAGWLLCLCALLIVWEPLSAAMLASRLLPSLADLDWPALAILGGRIFSAAVGISAGIGIWNRREHAVGLVKLTLVLSGFSNLAALATDHVPHSRLPGTTAPLIAVTLGYYAGWYVYLKRSRRVRATLQEKHEPSMEWPEFRFPPS